MEPSVLEYQGTRRPAWFEWRFLWGTFAILLFVLCWFSFSAYEWSFHHGVMVGYMYPLRRVRVEAASGICWSTFWFSVLNVFWLLAHPHLRARGWRQTVGYCVVAAGPMCLLLANEAYYADAVVN